MINKIKNLFKKEEKFSCIIFDGKKMKYLTLTKNEIEELKKSPETKDWTITIEKK